jgi:hypothetical protein
VRWDIGSRTGRTRAEGGGRGCHGLLTTLGAGALPKLRWWGVAWNVGADDRGVNEVKVERGGGLKVVLGASVGVILGGEGEATLGDSHVFTLGLAGAGRQVCWRYRGASKCQESQVNDLSKISNSFELGDTCGRWCALDSSCNNLQAVDDLIFCGRHRDQEVRMSKLHSIQDDLALGVGLDQLEAAVGV